MRSSVLTRPVIGAIALAVASGALLLPATTASAADTATVSILHAVPGATVDVYANGKALLTDFKPGTLTDPQQLPAGSYDLKVVAAGDGADGDAVAEVDNAKVPAGANVTVVAHLDADGDPRLSAYANDVSSLDAGQARLIVRHDAAAPATASSGAGSSPDRPGSASGRSTPAVGGRPRSAQQGPDLDDVVGHRAGGAGHQPDRVVEVVGLEQREARDRSPERRKAPSRRSTAPPSGLRTWTGAPARPERAPCATSRASCSWARLRTAGSVRS